ncbi:MAG: alpha-glucuronidase family glycosyl hydrolase [Tepidisphaeraceae bacterium]
MNGENGSKLWLRYAPLGQYADRYRGLVRRINVPGQSATARIIRDELMAGLSSLLGNSIAAGDSQLDDGDIVAGTPGTCDIVRGLGWKEDLSAAGDEGFVIRSAQVGNRRATVIASNTEVGALYGAYHFLRLIQTCAPITPLSIAERPRVQHRLLDHWDNLDGSIERGYAGKSLWRWEELPETLSPRYLDYARANASIGINGSVLNNVNADPRILSAEYLRKVAALADLWRPYGIRVHLSVNFGSPRQIGGLTTNDPFDPAVGRWWREKAGEIYQLIPDFGGFLVKANSEGQPGPQDYGRTHADGANVLADAVAEHGGIVMWRAFVYNEQVDPDRIKRAYIEFTALDGKFRPNVTVQVKNGPLDFMPREPFHPLFGGMTQSPVSAEIQATQEYLGQSKHLVYLGTLWKEFFDSDTFARGAGSGVGKVVEGTIYPYRLSGIVAVANTGTDANWCGHDFSQANWYAFGRLAWDHEIPAEHIAEEWVHMTFTNDPSAVDVIRDMMLSSRETYVNYTMPLGLHHLIGGDHYAPMPWNGDAPQRDWTATYYHRADAKGIGVDRTRRGDNAVSQYFPPVRDEFDDLARCPERFLLWFHRVAWDYKMRSGKTLWQELCDKYYQGHRQALAMQATWKSLAEKIDPDRHLAVSKRLEIQVADAAKWRDTCLQYFQRFGGMPIVVP